MMRKSIAPWLNALVPGAGLILLRREWLGLLLALLFGLCAQIGLWGLFIVPASVPRWVTVAALVGAGLAWVCAQYTLVVQLRRSFGPGTTREVERLCQQAEEAIGGGDYDTAKELLLVALTLNDEDPGANVQWARLMTALGHVHRARRAWARVVQLSP